MKLVNQFFCVCMYGGIFQNSNSSTLSSPKLSVVLSMGGLLETSPLACCVSTGVVTVWVLYRHPYCCSTANGASLPFLGDTLSQQTF